MGKSIQVRVMATVFGVAAMAGMAQAGDVTVGLDVASAYIFRGATLNEGAVAQPTLEVGGIPAIPGLSVGVWANFDLEADTIRGVESGQFSEVDLYGSYVLPLETEDAEVSIGYTEYIYPHANAAAVVAADGTASAAGVDADREISVTTSLELPLSPSVSVYYGLDGAIKDNLYAEAGLGHVVAIDDALSLSLPAVIGYSDPDIGPDGFSHAAFSGGLVSGAFTLLASYIVETDKKVLLVDEEFVVSIGASTDF
ncbi:MAG: hypothetical protein O3A51_13650 [Verrucomicrobia bacterium]|nr:hypothetical protein [Verrucomicrobiota bacterium]